MKTFLINIRAYGYHARFEIKSQDEDKAFENALVDKLGQNDIVWEKDGFSNPFKTWITYEEVIDANAHQRSLQSEEGSRNRVGGTATG